VPDTPYPLGRLREHDPRSRAYPFAAPARLELPKYSWTWSRRAPIFDQGSLGSCTGQAAAGWLGSDARGQRGNAHADQALAVSLYSEATRLDQWDGAYEPDDTGSSGVAVCKAMRNRQQITTYRHAFTFNAVLSALLKGPVLVGVPWLGDMFWPLDSGYLKCTGQEEGGHEFLIRGADPRRKHVLADNSWSTDWGRKGRFWLHWADLEMLLGRDGDCTVPVR